MKEILKNLVETMTLPEDSYLEQDAEILEIFVEEIEEIEKPKPKKMIFDKPFLILLKRKDAKNPYFGLWNTNTELMIKE